MLIALLRCYNGTALRPGQRLNAATDCLSTSDGSADTAGVKYNKLPLGLLPS